jgi:hypothetical protein
MLERIRRCRGCRVEVRRPPLEYEEVPYCSNCLSSGVTQGSVSGVTLKRAGRYIKIKQVARRPH